VNTWAEENFLERLTPQLREENRKQMESCPDAEMLTGFAEGRVSSFVRESVTAHLAQCLECSEICARLADFADATIPLPDTEWVNAEKRLENWMDGLLRVAESSRSAVEKVRVTPVDWLLRAAAFRWRMLWVVAATAAIAGVVGGTFLAKQWWMTSAPVQVARQGQAPVATAPAPNEGRETAKIPEPSPKAAEVAKNATPVARHKVSGLVGERTRSLPPSTVPNSAPGVAPSGDSSSQIAQKLTPPELSPNDRSPAVSHEQSSAPSTPANVAHFSQSQLGVTRRYYASAMPKLRAKDVQPSGSTSVMPVSLRFEAGTRLWINRVSTSIHPDGSFSFRGTLLEPVTQTGIVLDQDTEVDGSGSVKDGKVTVFVESLLVRGSTYKVQGARGTPSEQVQGAGKAVQFESGKLMEMWFSSASVYEKLSDTGSHDQAKP